MADLTAYFTELAHERRRNPTDDLATAIANGMPGGKLISIPDAIGYFIISATAGHDTDVEHTSAAVWALAERPQLLEQCAPNRRRLRGMSKNPCAGPQQLKHFMRTATTDVESPAARFRKGDWIMISYASGNRDEARVRTSV